MRPKLSIRTTANDENKTRAGFLATHKPYILSKVSQMTQHILTNAKDNDKDDAQKKNYPTIEKAIE